MSLRTYLQVGKVFEYQTRAPRTRCVSKKPAANILLGQSYKMSLGRNFQSFFIQPVTLQTFFQFSQMTNDNFFDLLLFIDEIYPLVRDNVILDVFDVGRHVSTGAEDALAAE